MTIKTTTGLPVLLSQITALFGSGAANIPPGGAGGTPSMRDAFQTLLAGVHPAVSNATTLTATLEANRSDGQLVLKLDDYTIWVWEDASVAAASSSVIVPTDVGAGAGRWVHVATASGADQGEMQHVSVPLSLATIRSETSGTAFNLGAALPANAQLFGVDVTVTTPVTGGTISACHLKVGDATVSDSAMGSTDVFTAAGSLTTAGTNPIKKRGGVQLKATLTAVGDTLAHATAGVLSVELYYAIIP